VITTSIAIALAMALFGLLVNSSAAGALGAYASGGLMSSVSWTAQAIYVSTNDSSTQTIPCGTSVCHMQEECPPNQKYPNNSLWCESNDPLKEEVPGLGGR